MPLTVAYMLIRFVLSLVAMQLRGRTGVGNTGTNEICAARGRFETPLTLIAA
jgi:hypothetical protein